MQVDTLRKRADFLKVQGSRHRFGRPAFLLACLPVMGLSPSARGLSSAQAQAALVGYTVTKKIGNAVVRNRTKRRLRALAVPILKEAGLPGHAYVWIARAGMLEISFTALRSDMLWALRKVQESARKQESAQEAMVRKTMLQDPLAQDIMAQGTA